MGLFDRFRSGGSSESAAVPDLWACSACGETYETKQSFCRECGERRVTKLSEEEARAHLEAEDGAG